MVTDFSFDDARAVATGDALRRLATEIAVIGGAEIYAQWMGVPTGWKSPRCTPGPTAIRISPQSMPMIWEEVARVRNPAGPDDSADFSYVTYRRRKPR